MITKGTRQLYCIRRLSKLIKSLSVGCKDAPRILVLAHRLLVNRAPFEKVCWPCNCNLLVINGGIMEIYSRRGPHRCGRPGGKRPLLPEHPVCADAVIISNSPPLSYRCSFVNVLRHGKNSHSAK